MLKVVRFCLTILALLILCSGVMGIALAEDMDAQKDQNEPVQTAGDGDEQLDPIIKLTMHCDYDVATEGVPVTIRATVENMPEGVKYTLTWQNDLSGIFKDIPDETGSSITFKASKATMKCKWRVMLHILDAEE